MGSYVNLIVQEAGRLINVSKHRRAESKASGNNMAAVTDSI